MSVVARGINLYAGHVDNMCCFIRPGVVALAWSDNPDDPQVVFYTPCLLLSHMLGQLSHATDTLFAAYICQLHCVQASFALRAARGGRAQPGDPERHNGRQGAQAGGRQAALPAAPVPHLQGGRRRARALPLPLLIKRAGLQ